MLFRELLVFVLCAVGDRKFRLLQQDITYYLHNDSWCLYVCILRTSHRQRENHFKNCDILCEWNGPECHTKTRKLKNNFNLLYFELHRVESTQCDFVRSIVNKQNHVSLDFRMWKNVDANHRPDHPITQSPNHPINRSCVWNEFIVFFLCCLGMNWIY